MAAHLRSATVAPRFTNDRRVRPIHAIFRSCRWIAVIVFLTVAITALIASTLPQSLPAAPLLPSPRPSVVNLSVNRYPLPLLRRRDSSFLPYPLNSSREVDISTPSHLMLNCDAEEGNIGANRPCLLNPSTSTVRSKVVKPSDGDGKTFPPTEFRALSRSLPTDAALVYAKKEIENASFENYDQNLYAPLFHNVSVFKRSYELMERILKVYIYPDGRRPIFRTPELKGIYASEGWFMKLIEQNKQFVVKDPNRAHLFYLPYSAHRLELALYVSGSHDMKPLSIFLRNYVHKISSKYPFWNRTRGSDHFLVACHDWGPYTTTLHSELRKNSIKALCNADTSEGIFIRGKDVSLPETSIRMPRRPLRQIGGRPVSQRGILAFFAGNMHGRVRPILLEHWGNGKDKDMRVYGPLPNSISRKTSYIEHMKSSRFCICPMGFEVNSPRIVEAIYYECVPVIIADNFVLPFDEVLDWSAFSLVVAEKDIPKLKDILLGVSMEKYLRMQESVKRLQRHFLWHSRPEKYDLFHMILHSIWLSRVNHIHLQIDNQVYNLHSGKAADVEKEGISRRLEGKFELEVDSSGKSSRGRKEISVHLAFDASAALCSPPLTFVPVINLTSTPFHCLPPST
ncbi:hypothetical protein HPP92_009495 [Vanilla planifolia]|uniref:Exostosin GT47 domain-containing protein n=1 Tax=Vanilla planifolia TaxID=51239 RepID=A0A835RGP7_VANPL|nr:hypothetical protein HPP92_009701 [Vanilla planifolia]KAG0487400.1 hypothetical protein HPP92_009495 [Vanilla planifolia]